MLQPKRKISAKAVAVDVLAGADDHALMTKYRLAPKNLDLLLTKLVEAEFITKTDLAMREFSGVAVECAECGATNPSHYKFCGKCGTKLSQRVSDCRINLTYSVESRAGCGSPMADSNGKPINSAIEKTFAQERRREVILSRVIRDIRSGFGYHVLLNKYNLSPNSFAILSNLLLQTGAVTATRLEAIYGLPSLIACDKCASFHTLRDRFCGHCGHSVGRSADCRRLTSPLEKDTSYWISPVHVLKQCSPATSQGGSPERYPTGLIDEMKSLASHVFAPLRIITRSKKRVNRAFYNACDTGQIGKVFRLLDAGAEVNGDDSFLSAYSDCMDTDQLWLHPLGIAARNGYDDIVTFLLEKGADVNKRGGFNLTTALMETRSVVVAQILLDNGADIDAADLLGDTALMSASSDGCVDMVRLLLDRGSKIDAVNDYGDTALMCACQYGPSRPKGKYSSFNRNYPAVVEMLLDKGADISIINKDGFTALQLADDWSHKDAVHVLRQAGACESVAQIDDNVLSVVMSMLCTCLGNSPHAAEAYFLIANSRKSVKINDALLFLAVSMLGKLARVDGVPNQAEMTRLRRFVAHSRWRNWMNVAEAIFWAGPRADHTSNAIVVAFTIDLGAFVKLFCNHEDHVKMVEDELFLMAKADGPINCFERHLLDLFVGEMERGIDREYSRADADKSEGGDAAKIVSCYVTLNCTETDSNERVKSQYRQLVKKYHPDAIQAKGLPEDFISFANKRFQEIQESYKTIMDYRRNNGSKS